jgi:hypothetical protein
MSNVNITINGDITVNYGHLVPSELETVIRELANAIIEDENAGSEGNRDNGFSIALITPDEIKTAVTFAECADFIDEMENGCEFRVKGECFNLFFERKGLMTFCNEYYLVIPAFTLFHDEQDRPVSADRDSLKALDNYIRENSTKFCFGDETVATLRLEGEFVEGV